MTKLQASLSIISIFYFLGGLCSAYATSCLERSALSGNVDTVERHLNLLDKCNESDNTEVHTVLTKVKETINTTNNSYFTKSDTWRVLNHTAKAGIYALSASLMGRIAYELCNEARGVDQLYGGFIVSGAIGILLGIKAVQHIVRGVKSGFNRQATQEHLETLLAIRNKLTQFLANEACPHT